MGERDFVIDSKSQKSRLQQTIEEKSKSSCMFTCPLAEAALGPHSPRDGEQVLNAS